MKWYDLVGLTGVVCCVLAYALLQMHRMKLSDYRYSLLNLIGAALVMVSLFYAFNLSSMLAQVVWIAISGFGLFKNLRARRALAVEA